MESRSDPKGRRVGFETRTPRPPSGYIVAFRNGHEPPSQPHAVEPNAVELSWFLPSVFASQEPDPPWQPAAAG